MSRLNGYVVSLDKILHEPWVPSEEEYCSAVGCDGCSVNDLPQPHLSQGFCDLVNEYVANGRDGVLPKAECHQTPAGTCIRIPKGTLVGPVEEHSREMLRLVASSSLDDYIQVTGSLHQIWKDLGINRFCTVVVQIYDDGTEEWDGFGEWIRGLYYTNKERDVFVYVYAAYTHHS